MADETFRPERKKVNMSDVEKAPAPPVQPVQQQGFPAPPPPPQLTPDQAKAQLEAMARLRQAMSEEDGPEREEPTLNPPQDRFPATPDESGVQITGNVPPGLKAALAAKGLPMPGERSAAQSKMGGQRRSTTTRAKPQNNDVPPEGGFRVTTGGSDLLKELVAGAKESVHQFEEITLPSLGKFYDGSDGPTDGKLWIRPMTGEEEQILATPRFVKRGQAINMIFQRCMRDKFRAEKFLTIDRTYLLIYLRGISYTPDYDVEVKCPECDRKFSHTINLNDLMVEECPEDFGMPLEDVLPTSGYAFRYRLSRGEDETHIQEYRERRIKMFGDQADDTLVYRTAMLLDDIEGLTDKKELQKLIAALPINDVAYIRNIVSEPPFGVDTNVEITCANCLQDFEVDLPLEANFFFPRAKKGKRTRV